MNNLHSSEKDHLLKTVSDFAKKHVVPFYEEWEDKKIFPREIYEKIGELGCMGMLVSEEYGGTGLPWEYVTGILVELAKQYAPVSAYVGVHNMVAHLICQYGSSEQKTLFLPLLSSAKKLGAFALTEPDAGSDTSAISTTALKSTNGYIVNGTKTFITAGGEADLYIVMAKTNVNQTSAFLIEKNTKGFQFGKDEKKLGYHTSATTELIFNDCVIPVENLIGKEGEGLKYALAALDGGRLETASVAVGIARAALEIAVNYAKTRTQFKRNIASFQAIQFLLADMQIDISAASLLINNAAKLKDAGHSATMEAAIAKCFATDMAMKVTVDAVQVLGGYGYMNEYKVERLMREAKLGQIVEGTNQIQRIIIARELLK